MTDSRRLPSAISSRPRSLSEFAVRSRGSVNPARFPDESFDLFSIPAYESGRPEELKGSLIGSSKIVVEPGDVLISKIVPHIQRVWIVPKRNGKRQIASGEWIVLRGEKIAPEFLRHMLLTKPFHEQFMQTVAGMGGSLLRARPSEVFRIEIPVPNAIEEQLRIAVILDKADAIRRKRERALKLADELLKSSFVEMFGDPELNPKQLRVREFGSLLEFPLRNGISPSSRGEVEAEVLTLSAITGSAFDPAQRKTGKFLVPISQKDEVSSSDFYICRGNGSSDLVGRGFFASQSMSGVAFPDTMIAARPKTNEIWPGFLETIWNSPFVRSQIVNSARTTNGTFKINQTATENIVFPVPPPAEQERYERVVSKIRSFKSRLIGSAYGEDLFASLSQRAFRGEL
jgi:type I restriction enzyme, S subunit